MQAGFYPDRDAFAARWSLDRRFEPHMTEADRERKYAGWRDAVSRTLSRRI
jgi:glycerol kinase